MRRWFRRIGAVGLVVALAAGVYFGVRLHMLAGIGSGYVAKQMCSCVFVSGREPDACRLDIPETMARVQANVLRDEGVVEARVPLLFASRRARFSGPTGCALQ